MLCDCEYQFRFEFHLTF